MIESPDPTEYSIAVKRNRKPRNSWRWEINRPGSPSQLSDHRTTFKLWPKQLRQERKRSNA